MGDGVSAEDRRAPDGATEPLFDARKLRQDATFIRSFIDRDSSQAGGFLDEFSAALLPLLDVLEAAHAEAASREIAGQEITGLLRTRLDRFWWSVMAE